jgi:hypothetical protein
MTRGVPRSGGILHAAADETVRPFDTIDRRFRDPSA